jgi:hypothetical protein
VSVRDDDGKRGEMAQRWIGLVTAAVLVTSCSSSRPTSRSSSGSPPVVGPATAWDRVLDQVGPDGSVSAATALQAFALAYGPLPGVTVPPGPVGMIRSGSGPIRWLISRWPELGPDQQAAASRLVPQLTGESDQPTARPSHSFVAPAHTAAKHPPAYYTALAASMADEITAHVGVTMQLTVTAAEGRTEKTTSAADTGIYNASGGKTGTATRCEITISPAGAAEAPDDLEDTIGHEVWHCFQGQIIGLAAFYSASTPPWIIEGQAEWVGDSLRPTAEANAAWNGYVHAPGRRLFARSYDAVGFYSHLTEAHVDTWKRLVPVLEKSDNVERFETSGATSDEFLDTWASGFFREPTYGTAWQMTGPGLTDAFSGAVRLVLTVDNGEQLPFAAAPYADAIFGLSSKADVVSFAVTGHARLADPMSRLDFVVNAGGTFCTRDGGCECPPGSVFSGAPPTPLSAESALAVTGGGDGTKGTITATSLEKFCAPQPTPGYVWHLDSPSHYSGGSSHTVIDAYACGSLRGPWQASVHITHGPASTGDPPLDKTVRFGWTFDGKGHAAPTVGPYQDTVFGSAHTIIYYPQLRLDEANAAITVVSLEGSEDGSPRIDVTDELDRAGEPVPVAAGKPPRC